MSYKDLTQLSKCSGNPNPFFFLLTSSKDEVNKLSINNILALMALQ